MVSRRDQVGGRWWTAAAVGPCRLLGLGGPVDGRGLGQFGPELVTRGRAQVLGAGQHGLRVEVGAVITHDLGHEVLHVLDLGPDPLGAGGGGALRHLARTEVVRGQARLELSELVDQLAQELGARHDVLGRVQTLVDLLVHAQAEPTRRERLELHQTRTARRADRVGVEAALDRGHGLEQHHRQVGGQRRGRELGVEGVEPVHGLGRRLGIGLGGPSRATQGCHQHQKQEMCTHAILLPCTQPQTYSDVLLRNKSQSSSLYNTTLICALKAPRIQARVQKMNQTL